MKKIIFITVCLLLSTFTFGVSPYPVIGTPIPLQVGILKPTHTGNPKPKSPITIPCVSIDDNTLYFYEVDYDLTLELVNCEDEDDIVYSVTVPANNISVNLPYSLTGDYELRLYPGGDHYFYYDITL